MNKRYTGNQQTGFTLVELLIVIVVIGILATVSIVAYVGMRDRATSARISSNLNSISKQIDIFYVENGRYPSSIGCPASGQDQICVASQDSTETIEYSNQGDKYDLAIVRGQNVFRLGSGGNGLDISPRGVSKSGLVAHYDAGRPDSYTDNSTSWRDVSGNGNNASITSVSSTGNGAGKELVLNSTSSLFKTPTVTARSVMMIVKLDSSQTIDGYLIDARPGLGTGYIYSRGIGSDWVKVMVDGSAIHRAWSNIQKGRWISIYLESSTQFTSTINILSRYSNSERHAGSLGAVMIYSKVLSQAEIEQNIGHYRSIYGLK